MASIRINALPGLTASLGTADMFAVDLGAGNVTRKATLAQVAAGLGLRPFTVATLPTGYTGGFIFVTNGRKVGEGSGAGTGVVCSWNGSNWITIDAGTTVAA